MSGQGALIFGHRGPLRDRVGADLDVELHSQCVLTDPKALNGRVEVLGENGGFRRRHDHFGFVPLQTGEDRRKAIKKSVTRAI